MRTAVYLTQKGKSSEGSSDSWGLQGRAHSAQSSAMLPGGNLRSRKKDGIGQKRAMQIGILAVAMTMAALSVVDPRHITESALLQTKLCSVVYCPGMVRVARLAAHSPALCMCGPPEARFTAGRWAPVDENGKAPCTPGNVFLRGASVQVPPPLPSPSPCAEEHSAQPDGARGRRAT